MFDRNLLFVDVQLINAVVKPFRSNRIESEIPTVWPWKTKVMDIDDLACQKCAIK